ncbi:MAG: hypothetical protein ACJZ5B_02075 [Candidatus Poseidoniaceae archaeon]
MLGAELRGRVGHCISPPSALTFQRNQLLLSTPIDLGSGRTALAVSAGSYHACAILDNGDLKCWGYDRYGQWGDWVGGITRHTWTHTFFHSGRPRCRPHCRCSVCWRGPHLRHS